MAIVLAKDTGWALFIGILLNTDRKSSALQNRIPFE